ncbi:MULTISPECIES: hypothetical protein [Paenibacillus]|uniref:Uncharacterized protein n=2 Tax=Paenibacillus TaxID=44249 RepID=A0A3S8RQW8_9BACL|nr:MULTISPECIES: hypothetical protein [Paenibacillus]AZK45346.1 hypothetical protein EIM92_03270 [Paenibacillus lentus]MUG46982.1 hypothetical protein [Paenibacillus woosongensis]
MQNKRRIYGGISLTLILILIAYIIYMQFNYQVHTQQEAQERQKTEQLLRSKEKQIEFYFKKANELISTNQKLEMKIDSFDGGEIMELDDQLVSEVLDSREYKEIMAKYEEHYGILDKVFIPENETLGGLRYKVKESIAAGYDLLPKYYGITNALMWMDTKEFKELNKLFKEHFGDVIPTEVIYGTFEELNDIVHKSVKEGKNLLPEYYGYGRNG